MIVRNPFLGTLIPLSLFLMLVSCLSKQQHSVSEKLVHGMETMWASKNLEMIDTLFADDCVYEDVPDSSAYYGKEDLKTFIGEIFVWSPDTRVEYKATYISDDWAVLEWIWSGTQTGDMDELMPATGRFFSIHGVTILEFQNDRIKRNTDYYNAGRFMYQLGVKFEFPSGVVLERRE